MAESILKYEAGMAAKQASGSNNKARLGAAIAKLGDSIGKAVYQNDMIKIRESQKAAEADMIRNAIDPNREQEDAAYAGVTLRNRLFKENKMLQSELDNPASELYKMDPDQFQEYLQTNTDEAYQALAKGPHSDTNTEILSNFTVAAQAGLVAKHSKTYKENRKVGMNKEAIDGLTDLPAGEGDEWDANTAIIIESMLPSNMFTAEERMKSVMASARAAAGKGDRRLLDFANKYLGTDIFLPNEAANAEQAHVEWTRTQQDKKYVDLYQQYEAQSRMGGITKEKWQEIHNDPEAVRRWGRSTIDSWWKASVAEHKNALTYADSEAKFLAGDSMGGAPAKVQQEVYANVLRDSMARARQAGTDDAKLQELGGFVQLMSKQSEPYKELRQNMDAHLGRPVFTKEGWASEKFQDSLLIFRAMKENLSPEQLIDQVGQEAYMNGMIADEAIMQADGDMERAGAIYIMTKDAMDKQPELKTGYSPDPRVMAENMNEILSGDVKGSSDPNMSGVFSRQVRGADAFMTSQLDYEYRKAYGLARARQLSDASAHEYAKTTVAARTKVFGGELHYTGGVRMPVILGMDPASTDKDLDKAYELLCEDLDLDPNAVHFKISGNYGVLVGPDGLPVSGKAMFPLALVGQRYQQWRADEAEAESTTSATVRAKDIAKRNRYFEHQLDRELGGPMRGSAPDDTPILADGTTIGQFRMADEDVRTRIRNMHAEERRTVIGKAIKHIYDNIVNTMENPETDPYRQRWKTKSWARDPEGELRMELEEKTALDRASKQAPAGAVDKPTKEKVETPLQKEANVMRDVSKVKAQIKRHEDFSPYPYEDAKDTISVGYGRNLSLNPLTAEEWRVLGGKRSFAEKPITKAEAEYLLENDLANSVKAVDRLFSEKELSGRRRDVLINMVYNMGEKSVHTFENMIEAIRAGDYEEAAFQMLYNDRSGSKTKWYKQVKSRAEELAAIMRKG